MKSWVLILFAILLVERTMRARLSVRSLPYRGCIGGCIDAGRCIDADGAPHGQGKIRVIFGMFFLEE